MHDLQSGMAAGRRQSSASGSKSHRTTLYCRQADSACDRKAAEAIDLQSVACRCRARPYVRPDMQFGLAVETDLQFTCATEQLCRQFCGIHSAQVGPISLHLVAPPSFGTPAGHIKSAGDFHEGTVCCGTRRQLMKTPDSRSCPLREPMENRRVRSNGFRVTRFTSLRCVPVRLMSLSQVFCRNAKVEIQ